MAEVYWIHCPEHTDFLSQGYIGVTSRTSALRYAEHLYKSKTDSWPLHNAINKHKDELIVETLVISDLEYAYEIEAKLRPVANIGWNLSEGGYNKPTGRIKPYVKTNKKRGSTLIGVPKEQTHRDKISESRKKFYQDNPIPVGVSTTTNSNVWSKADILFESYSSGIGITKMSKLFELSISQISTMVYKHFKNGWNPNEDSAWLTLYKKEESS